MFLCKDCHNPERHFMEFGSYGNCESCRKTTVTIDCHIAGCEEDESDEEEIGQTE